MFKGYYLLYALTRNYDMFYCLRNYYFKTKLFYHVNVDRKANKFLSCYEDFCNNKIFDFCNSDF